MTSLNSLKQLGDLKLTEARAAAQQVSALKAAQSSLNVVRWAPQRRACPCVPQA
ncbi:MAG: hypothetical protein AAFX99_12740 [Myxococcota bacterium]